MPRVCEVCGRVEETEHEENRYRILDVCPECTEHLIHPSYDMEQETEQKP
ncbi:hypothetical protein [Oceanobacillus senegalensis]|nr:hypothetical protein [Oceanobacillus senegalensis]